jgi:CRP-like cAMP-binding protein
MLTVIEKVKLLLQIDILAQSTSEELAYIAAIAEEEELPARETIFRAGDPADAMFVVITGRIQMLREGSGDLDLEVGPGEAIGAWALFDDQPRTLTAATLTNCRLLRIDREQFFDLLSDHGGITQGIFKTLVRRIRSLAETAL